ncbi:MAG: hydrogenase maturation peptidase HycI [Methanobacteriaceae archaeon]|nr:hydrogenase maturation peptidase HycI [Methanobacteriaceae archaeon]MDO9626771.1 hydrogenase maturation peptidase HycI [Methanobacteriaceae archaeon]
MTIGNELRGDDGLGPLFANKFSKITKNASKVIVIDGGIVPENFTGTIRKENPSHVILIDAVEMNAAPGDMEVISKEKISQYNVSTHSMPISFLIKYLETTSSFKIILLGIQPQKMELGEEITEKVQISVNKLVDVFKNIFNDLNLI